jgi:internalin A
MQLRKQYNKKIEMLRFELVRVRKKLTDTKNANSFKHLTKPRRKSDAPDYDPSEGYWESKVRLAELELGAWELIFQADEQQLTKLDISGKGLSKIPEAIYSLKNLASLNIGQNLLTSLPNDLFQIATLSQLDISANRITHIPSDIQNLPILEVLQLAANPIIELPEEISQLKKLKILNLVSCKFNEFPEQLVNISSLEILQLGNNTNYPIYYSSDLSVERSGNNISKIPKSIRKLKELKYLDLRGNHLRELPIEILDLHNLEFLNLAQNSLPIPPEILDKVKEPYRVLNYYFSFTSQNKKPINEIKLLFIGQGSVGKSSIIEQILYSTYTPNLPKTEGISINQWQINLPHSGEIQTSNIIKLNIWDFGGQEIMHATHQFFLTRRSLYLLALDARLTQEENRIEYWLKIIQSFAGESPVLIVGNKIDQHLLDIDRTGLQKKYPNIVGILETSAATGAGIDALKVAITEQVNNLPHVHDLLPETWFTVKTKLEEMGKGTNFISHDDYDKLCDNNDVHDETSQHTLIGFLHDLGVILYFQDDPRLESLGILNPQWVTNGVYKILNSQVLFQNKGVLTVSMLDEILNLPEYPRGKRLFIVDMMKKFELCYDIETDKRFLIPDLLPKDEPATGDHQNSLAFQYHYTVLPSSVVTRFIVRTNEFIDELVWRSGVTLKDGGSTALVKADIEERKVFIWVSGDEYRRHDFLSKIRGQFDAIHKTISKLEVKEMVPVPGHPEAEPVDYDLLLQMDHNNVDVYPVLSNGKMIIVKVREMLSGVVRQEDRQRGNVTNVYIGGNLDGNMIIGDDNVSSKN